MQLCCIVLVSISLPKLNKNNYALFHHLITPSGSKQATFFFFLDLPTVWNASTTFPLPLYASNAYLTIIHYVASLTSIILVSSSHLISSCRLCRYNQNHWNQLPHIIAIDMLINL